MVRRTVLGKELLELVEVDFLLCTRSSHFVKMAWALGIKGC